MLRAKGYQSCLDFVGKGARGVTVGTANTGDDVAEDMTNAGLHTTMLQRGSTMIMPGPWLLAADGAQIPNNIADMEQFTMPLKVVRQMINKNVHAGIKAHPEQFDARARASGL